MTAHTILTARLGPREYLVQVWPDHAEISTRNYGGSSWGPPTTMRREDNGDEPVCECVGYSYRTDYGTGVEYDVDRSSCPIHASGADDAELAAWVAPALTDGDGLAGGAS